MLIACSVKSLYDPAEPPDGKISCKQVTEARAKLSLSIINKD
jgi:hypothetical protein